MTESHNQSSLSYPGAYYKYLYDYHSNLYFASTVVAIRFAKFSISNLCIFVLGVRLYAMSSFTLNIFSPLEMQCVYCITGTEFLNIIPHFMLQRVTASRLHQTCSIQFVSLQFNSLPCNYVSSLMLLGIIMPLLPQAFLTNFHIFTTSTHSVCSPYCLTTVTVPHQQNVFELSQLYHIKVFYLPTDAQ